MGMDLGPAIPQGGGIGVLFNLEPKVNLSNHMNVGIRFGVAGVAKDITYYNFTEDYEGEISANLSIAGIFDYYFNRGKNNVAPYLGIGYGYYALSNLNVSKGDFDTPEDIGNLDADFKWAPILRAGVELGKFRMGAEYNFVPKSNLQNTAGEVIGDAINQYLGFTIGFYVGGGRWKKNGTWN